MGKQRILVTGAAGFMGSYAVDQLIKEGYEVWGIDDLSGGFLRNVDGRCQFRQLDLRKKGEVFQYVAKLKPTLIYHLAADASEGRSQFTPLSATERNYVAYMNLLVSSIANGLTKMVLISSMSVYGNQTPPFSEDMERAPVDIYGLSKTAMERATEILSEIYDFDYTIVRPHNVYGPRQNLSDPYRNVIGIFINSLLRKKPFFIYGDGEQKRSFTYIDDCTPQIVRAGFENSCNGEIINVGSTEVTTINELARIILKEFFEGKIPPKSLLPKYLPLRPLEVEEAYCTSDKARKLLGYQTLMPLEKGIGKMIAWARKVGPQKPKYLNKLELEATSTPQTWKNKLI